MKAAGRAMIPIALSITHSLPDRFMPADFGQMEFYLRWLKQHEKRHGEADPRGIILCADASAQRIEVLKPAGRGIQTANFLTTLLPRKMLDQRSSQPRSWHGRTSAHA